MKTEIPCPINEKDLCSDVLFDDLFDDNAYCCDGHGVLIGLSIVTLSRCRTYTAQTSYASKSSTILSARTSSRGLANGSKSSAPVSTKIPLMLTQS